MIAYEIEVERVHRETIKVIVEKDWNSDALSVLGTLMVNARKGQSEGETTRILGVHPLIKHNGGVLECGCWSGKVGPGMRASSHLWGSGSVVECPEHGPQVLVRANVEEPDEAYFERMQRWGA